MPFAVGPDAQLLERVGPGILWIAALTAALLPIERLIEPDRADGTLDQVALHGLTEESLAVAKIAAHWLTTGLPVAMLAPLLGVRTTLWVTLLVWTGWFAPALVDRRRRTLHDLLAGTELRRIESAR